MKQKQSRHPLYFTWYNMVRRTSDIKDRRYSDYGGRGISVCDRWRNINNFVEDMYDTYSPDMSLDRIDNNGNYELSNCRWATKEVQARNTKMVQRNNKSGYRGVCRHREKWISKICVNRKSIHIGLFEDSMDAAIAYNRYVIDNNLEHTLNQLGG